MDSGTGDSFRVHLQSLEDFAQRLREQLEVVNRSTRAAPVLNRPPDLPLGAFAEAFALSDDHSDAVRQAEVLLEKVAGGIDFARSVTELVAQRYAALNAAGARSIGAVGESLPAAPDPLLPTVQPAPAYPPPAPVSTVTARPVTGTVYYSRGSTQDA